VGWPLFLAPTRSRPAAGAISVNSPGTFLSSADILIPVGNRKEVRLLVIGRKGSAGKGCQQAVRSKIMCEHAGQILEGLDESNNSRPHPRLPTYRHIRIKLAATSN
jgi:hypothetical protein